MRLAPTVAAAAGLASSVVEAVSTFSPARPPAIPLAVRSPYLNTWLNGDDSSASDGYLPGKWPVFWTQSITGWQGFIRVDGTVYNWMGAAPGPKLVDQLSFSYTSTQSNFVMSVDGKVEMNITFMSPVYPDDLGRQSLTHSYLDVAVRSKDGAPHSVQLYADVSAEWASADKDAIIKWETATLDDIRFHKFYRENQQVFGEANDQANWGNWYWATADGPGVTFQSGADTSVRQNFVNNGVLPNTADTDFRKVSDRWPVFGLARDFGNVNAAPMHNLFTIGYAQEKAIRFQGVGNEPQEVPSLWTSYLDELPMLSLFYKEYDDALARAKAFDAKIAQASIAAGGQDYLTITSLSVRQTFGALQFCGTSEKPLIFLKEISSNSDIQTVDVIFPASPLLLYLNPELLKYTLEPLLENQESGHYPRTSAIHDLGRFPNALGYPDGNDEPMPLEESGNMVIMMLAYAQRTGNKQYLKDHWNILANWTQYLLDDAKIPAEQLSTDDFAGHLANQTNLAIKGIIALKAMAQVAQLVDRPGAAETFGAIADNYLDFWMNHGINKNAELPHTNLQYDRPETHGILYNLYNDRLLKLNFVPQSVYDMQSKYYPTIAMEYGVPLDTRKNLTKSDWEMFAAAVSSPDTRKMFIQKLANWINKTPTHRPMTDLYMVDSGNYPDGILFTARPVVGGSFALLALDA